ncbi:oligosaccharide flippase family protein [Qipengyuania sp. ASV99]|uniref:oligosaccharide flippase family protein n=1 Tax=Qipengyuania sp. ASV99 TaxID=3399681 RepID=UPI003A4C6BDE
MAAGRFLKAGSTLGLGYVGEHALLFLRVLLVARFLGPEYFGISVTFLLVVSTFALISDLGIEKYLIQVREGALTIAMPTLASVLLARGVLMGTAIFLLSDWIASSFGNPQLGWFYACAAIIPVIEGFRHLDPLAQQRQMHFSPYVKMQLGGLLPGVLLTIALAIVTESFIAIAAGCIATSIISVTLSHILARSPYRLGFDKNAALPVFVFGWPLFLNGIVIFLATQGDRIVIGTLGGMLDLAGYAAVGALTGGAAVFFARLCGNLFLPLLSEARDNIEMYRERCRTTGAACLLLLSAVLFPLATLGAPIVLLMFGPGYVTPPLLVTFLSILAGATVLRAWCVVISLSLGGTSDILTANILRISGLVGAYLVLSSGHGIVWVAASMCAGDVAATVLALFQVSRRAPAARSACLTFGLVFVIMAAILIALNSINDPFADLGFTAFLAIATSAPGIITALLVSRDLRQRLKAVLVVVAGKIYRHQQ